MDPRHTPLWRVQNVPQPAAGAELVITPVNAAGWLVQSMRIQFVADANVAARAFAFNFTDGTTIWGGVNANSSAAAGQTRTLYASRGNSAAIAGTTRGSIDWPTPGVWLPQGYSIVSVTENLQVGDQYSQIALSVIEYPSGEGLVMWPFPPSYLEESS